MSNNTNNFFNKKKDWLVINKIGWIRAMGYEDNAKFFNVVCDLVK